MTTRNNKIQPKLPVGVYPIAEIKSDKKSGNKVINLGTLLGYLLYLVNPGLSRIDRNLVTIGDRVKAHKHLFLDYEIVLFAIHIRNRIVHPETSENYPVERYITQAIDYLLLALDELLHHPSEILFHPKIPNIILWEIFNDAYREEEEAQDRYWKELIEKEEKAERAELEYQAFLEELREQAEIEEEIRNHDEYQAYLDQLESNKPYYYDNETWERENKYYYTNSQWLKANGLYMDKGYRYYDNDFDYRNINDIED